MIRDEIIFEDGIDLFDGDGIALFLNGIDELRVVEIDSVVADEHGGAQRAAAAFDELDEQFTFGLGQLLGSDAGFQDRGEFVVDSFFQVFDFDAGARVGGNVELASADAAIGLDRNFRRELFVFHQVLIEDRTFTLAENNCELIRGVIARRIAGGNVISDVDFRQTRERIIDDFAALTVVRFIEQIGSDGRRRGLRRNLAEVFFQSWRARRRDRNRRPE